MEWLLSPQPEGLKRRSFRRSALLYLSGPLMVLGILAALNYPWVSAQLGYRLRHYPRTTPVLGVATATAATPALKPDPSAPAEITIPAIHITAPIIFDEPSQAEWKIQLALRRGVVHYGDTAVPGQNGNIVIVGHSSGQAWAPGDYKWIFTLLNKLHAGDQIEIAYQGIPHVYEVTGTTIVSPTDLSVTTQTPGPTLTLITCTPVGTSTNRLVVHAKELQPSQSR